MKSFVLLIFCLIFVFADCALTTFGVKNIHSTSPRPLTAKVQNVTVETISDEALIVSWDALPTSEEDGEILAYIVKYRPSSWLPKYSSFYSKRSSCRAEHCSLKLNYLDEFTEYTIGVAARYLYDDGPLSDMVNWTTAVRTPYEPPQHLFCQGISSEQLYVLWESPPNETIHGVFKGYNVFYGPTLLFDDEEKRELNKTMATEMVLHGLKKNMYYAIKVSASNSAGDGVKSETVLCSTLEDVPDEPVDFKVIVHGAEEIQLLWHAPLLQESGNILYYNIYYQKSGSEAVSMERVSASQTDYKILELESNIPYEFWLTASTKAGEGPPSEYITATPSNETPPKIRTYNETFTIKFKEYVRLSCDAIGSPTPNVTWKVNDDNLIPNERLQILANGSLIIQSVIREDANNYTCIATNAFGNDSITHELIVKAPPKSPQVTVLSTKTDEIKVYVKKNSVDLASFDGFKLYYKFDSQIDNWRELVMPDFEYTIRNCICGSSYLVYAKGFNEIGYGDASEILTVKTNGSKPIAPASSDFIEPAAGAVKFHFSSWNAESCPISHFFLAFKEKKSIRWNRVHDKFQPDTDFVLNLESDTLYDIRVIAHNAAGATKADYEVATLAEPSGTIAPTENIIDSE